MESRYFPLSGRTAGGTPAVSGAALVGRLRPLWFFLTASAVLAALLFSGQDAEESGSLSAALAAWILSLLRAEYTAAFFLAFHHFLRKAAHFTLYCIFGCGLSGLLCRPGRLRRTFLLSVLLSALYASSDEFHQYFVQGRAASWKDVCLDTAGASAGALLIMLLCVLLDRRTASSRFQEKGFQEKER